MRLSNNKETKGRLDSERQVQELERILKDRDSDIRRYNEELDFSRVNNEKLVEDNEKLFSEIEKLKNHIILLTEQNQKLRHISQEEIELTYLRNRINSTSRNPFRNSTNLTTI
jgi:predicted nucleotidyltransferase component of viral defense system